MSGSVGQSGLNPRVGDALSPQSHHQSPEIVYGSGSNTLKYSSPEIYQDSQPHVPVISQGSLSDVESKDNTVSGDVNNAPTQIANGKTYEMVSTEEYKASLAPKLIKRRSWLKRWWSPVRWTKEIVAIIFSWIFQAGVIIILASMEGKPQSRWHFFATINAVMSVLGTIGKGCLAIAVGSCISQWKWLYFHDAPRLLKDLEAYDSASRGTMGSIKFLYKIRWNLATLGAFVTILAFLMDPFNQQILSFETRDVFVANNETAGYAFTHEYQTKAQLNAEGTWLSDKKTNDNAMLAAILRGVYNLGEASISNCSSTCQWDGPYHSLGFRNTCTNVTEATLASQKCYVADSSSGQRRCNMTTPGGVHLKNVYIRTMLQTLGVVNSTRLAPITIKNTTSGLTRMAVYRAASREQPQLTPDLVGEEIVECSLDLVAITTSNITATSGQLNTESTQVTSLADAAVNYIITKEPKHEAYVSFRKDPLPELRIGSADMANILDFLSSGNFIGSIFDMNGEYYAPADLKKSEGVAGGFFNGNISATMERMASSMNEYVRTGVNQQVAVGSATVPEIFVQVNWVWVSVPVIANVGAMVLLALTIWNCARNKDVLLFKQSNVALLYHDVVSPGGVLRSSIQRVEELVDIGEEVRVKLD